MDQTSQLPREVSLGDVFGDIKMTPGEATAFLTYLSSQFLNGSHHTLGLRFRDYGALVSDPQTYGYKPPERAPSAPETAYTPPTADNVKFADLYGGRPAPAAQGQSQEFETTNVERSPSQTQYAATAPAPVTPANEPQWMRDARAAGWNPSQQTQDAPSPSQDVYKAPSCPPVSPQYRQPYTSSESPVSEPSTFRVTDSEGETAK